MAIEDDIELFKRVPVLNLLGGHALQVLAIGAEQHDYHSGDALFVQGEAADCGFVVRSGHFRIVTDDGVETSAGPNALIGELAMMAAMKRPATAIALEPSSVLRISRSLFQRILESHPDAAVRLRDDLAARTNAAAAALSKVSAALRS